MPRSPTRGEGKSSGGRGKSSVAFPDETRFLPAMISEAPVLQQTTEPAGSAAAPSCLSRYPRPLLGVLLTLTLALGWEFLVWRGWSNGRLVPPPSRVFATIADLARSGELVRHIAATLWRGGVWFWVGGGGGALLRAPPPPLVLGGGGAPSPPPRAGRAPP